MAVTEGRADLAAVRGTDAGALLSHPPVPPAREGPGRPPFADFRAYLDYLERARRDPDAYWAEIASELEWMAPWARVRTGDLPDFKYFVGGLTNVSVNCIDRHLRQGRKNKAAIVWEGEPGDRRVWTYQMLHDETCRVANALRQAGVGKGDVVAVYLPNLPETFAVVHACYRIGAIYNVIFSGFSADAVRSRLLDSRARLVITADATYRRGRVIPLKRTLDEALDGLDFVERVVVVRRAGIEVPMAAGRDVPYDEFVRGMPARCEPEPLEANEPGFIIYTSGTTARPKGLVHAGAGFLVGAYANVKWSLNLQDDDVYWCTADVGWLTFPIFALVGGLAHGATHVVYEGALDYPSPGRFYEVAERYRVNKIFTAPTALRMLSRYGPDWPRRYDLSALELIALVGEPLDPETWYWVRRHVGDGRVEINNTYGQTETGTAWISGVAGVTPARPGSCGLPLFGYQAEVVDEQGRPVPPGTTGYLLITAPFPCLARTIWGDHQRYLDTYFSRFPGRYFTGDAAVYGDDGHFWVLGRVDDVINVAGHRLSTMELESALINHPLVAEAAVVGVPDAIKGTVPVAFVVLKSGVEAPAGVEDQLKEEIARRISPIARPARVYVVDAMPKTRSGKIMRRLLREAVAEGRITGDTTALEDPEVLERIVRAVGPAGAPAGGQHQGERQRGA
ncbi:MAG: acetate--CoA ligase [Bacillota bacterium]|nr:MAG: acetate--CoA ligase [Bacillota bacterium]